MGAKLKVFLALAMTFLLLLPNTVAETFSELPAKLSPEILKKFEKPISLDLRGISAIDVLKFVSTQADVNIVASPKIDTKVTLFLKNVNVGSAFDIILLSAGLAFREKGGILYVMTDEEYTALYGQAYRDQRSIKIVSLKYADPSKVGEILSGLKSTVGKVVVDKQTATVVLMDMPEKISLMEDAITRIDISTVERQLPTQTAVFELDYNKATELEPKIQSLLTTGIGSVKADDKTNTLVVIDFPPAIERISKLLKAFDRKTREVYIEAKMIQVRLSNEYQMGINWEQIFNEGPERKKFPIDLLGTFPAQNISGHFGKMIIGNLGRKDIQATVNMLHTFGSVKTLAAPQLTAENNEEANILVGTREAYVTSTVSQATSTTTTSESITFVDVGVKLKVQSIINKQGFISMKIAPEVSAVGRTLTTLSGNQIPIVDTTTASTRVLVKDAHTVLIGGLMKDENSKTVHKYPILGDLPFVGALFRSTDDESIKTELVIFLTPHIVEGDEELPVPSTASGKPFEGLRSFQS